MMFSLSTSSAPGDSPAQCALGCGNAIEHSYDHVGGDCSGDLCVQSGVADFPSIHIGCRKFAGHCVGLRAAVFHDDDYPL